jgi:hypothetical protein
MAPTSDRPETNAAPRQLLAYAIPPRSRLEGQLIGALERVESGGTVRILDALFVGRDAESGEVIAVAASADGSSGMIGRLISFRLDAGARATATERALAGPSGELVRTLAEPLEPGASVIAVLVEHAWEQVLADAVARLGGESRANEFVDVARICDAWAPQM